MVVALKPLHDAYHMLRVVVSTYQSVTGTGQKAVTQLQNERNNTPGETVYPHPIDFNALPHIDVFMDNGYTKEEWKMMVETRKIMELPNLKITATTVRIPAIGGHSESINAAFAHPFDIEEIKSTLAKSPGITLQDDPANNLYPMPITSHNLDDVFVGRIRRDDSAPILSICGWYQTISEKAPPPMPCKSPNCCYKKIGRWNFSETNLLVFSCR